MYEKIDLAGDWRTQLWYKNSANYFEGALPHAIERSLSALLDLYLTLSKISQYRTLDAFILIPAVW